jgi:hypothetical protein
VLQTDGWGAFISPSGTTRTGYLTVFKATFGRGFKAQVEIGEGIPSYTVSKDSRKPRKPLK